MHLNATYKNSWNRKQNKVCVTLDSELYRRKPVLTYAISGNVVDGFGEFGENTAALFYEHRVTSERVISVAAIFKSKLEGRSVERIHFRQRSSDGSVNKTILKPRLALASRRQYCNTYTWDFPDVKFRVAAQLAGSLARKGWKVP